jgi:hypothetical protein
VPQIEFDERARGCRRARLAWRSLAGSAVAGAVVAVVGGPNGEGTARGYGVIVLFGVALWAAGRANINTHRLRRPENKRLERERKRARVERAIGRRNERG